MGGKDQQSSSSSSSQNANNQGVTGGFNGNFGMNQGGSFGFTNGGSQNTSGSQGTGFSEGQSTSSGGSFNAGGSEGTSSSTQDIWGEQSPFLQEVYNAASQGNADAQAAIQNLQPGIQEQMGKIAIGGQQGFDQMLTGGNAANLGPSQVAGLQSNVAQLGPTQASQLGPSAQGAMQGQGLQQQMLNNYNGNNPYMSGMKDMIAQDASRLKQQNLGSLDARAAAAGMSGSSGYRNQVSDMMENVDENAMNAMTNLGYQSNTQAIQDRMRLSGAADQMNMNAAGAQDQYNMGLAGMNDQSALQRAGMSDQFNMATAGAGDQYAMQQAGMMDQNMMNAIGQTGAMQNSAMSQFNPSMMGQQAAAMFGQTIGGPTTLTSSQSENSSFSSGGSSQESQSTNMSQNQNSSSGQGTSFNNGMNMGFNNGMNVGMGINGGFNAGSSSGTSTSNGSGSGWNIAPPSFNFSDAALKDDIEFVEQIDGVNLYQWKWKDEAPVWSDMNYGVLAQEVAVTHPNAVRKGGHGYLEVDYSKLGRAGEKALAKRGA